MTKAHRDLNSLKPDLESVVTGFGRHNRVVAFLPGYDSEFECTTLYARVDHVNDLRDPTEREILKVARRDQGVKGRFVLLLKRRHEDGNSTDFHFRLLEQ